jgi:hypothetical protein
VLTRLTPVVESGRGAVAEARAFEKDARQDMEAQLTRCVVHVDLNVLGRLLDGKRNCSMYECCAAPSILDGQRSGVQRPTRRVVSFGKGCMFWIYLQL